MKTRSDGLGFLIWSAEGFLLAFGFVGAASIGLPFLLIGLLLLIPLLRRGPVWPADLGLIAGVGGVCLLIAAINAASGDLSPTIWLTVGLALMGLSVGAFSWVRQRRGFPRDV